MPEFILKIPTAGAKQIDFIYRKTKESKMLFHFFLIFFLFSVIASIYLAVPGSSTVDNCINNCTATYSESFTCANLADPICESLSNPRENVAAGSDTTLANIPCRFTTNLNTGCT